MPLRFVRKRTQPDASDVLQWAVTATSITKDLANMMQFAPASVAASLLLSIFQTINSLQINQDACQRLARRAAHLLFDIRDHMEGRWENAPPQLLRNLKRLEATLSDIYACMKRESQARWGNRFLRKATIEDALLEFNAQLDDAATSFQIASLISIQYDINVVNKIIDTSLSKILAVQDDPEAAPPPYKSNENEEEVSNPSSKVADQSEPEKLHQPSLAPSADAFTYSEESFDIPPEEILETTIVDDCGFRRFHQSEIVLRGRSRLKDGWWKGGMEVEVEGRKLLMKQYGGEGSRVLEHWVQDVKILQNLHHPNLPQMMGFSNGDAPTPFLVLTNVATASPQHLLLRTLRSKNLAATAELALRFYRDITDAAIYLQQQLNLSDSQLQDFVQYASYRVDGKAIVMGLPPPKEKNWITVRSYGLTESLRDACLRMLPNGGRLLTHCGDEQINRDEQSKINHLVTLARGLLPLEGDPFTLAPRVESLLGDEDEEGFGPGLRQIRMSNLSSHSHDHTWTERTVPPHKFSVGDLGYIPVGGDFESFQTLKTVPFSVKKHAWGEQWCWEHVPIRREPLQSYELPDGATCWPVAVSPQQQVDTLIVHEASVESVTDAWHFLLGNAKNLGETSGVRPEDLILVTRVGTNQDFYIRQFGPLPGLMPRLGPHFAQGPRPGFPHSKTLAPQFPVPHNPAFQQTLLPKIFYLFTSLDSKYEPYWSQSPVSIAGNQTRPSLDRGYTYRIGFKHGFLNYVQLHPEDFL